eukprot:17775-Hanusia_phi.AAC.1
MGCGFSTRKQERGGGDQLPPSVMETNKQRPSHANFKRHQAADQGESEELADDKKFKSTVPAIYFASWGGGGQFLREAEQQLRKGGYYVIDAQNVPKDVFLSHSWQKMVDGSDAHQKVKKISRALEHKG